MPVPRRLVRSSAWTRTSSRSASREGDSIGPLRRQPAARGPQGRRSGTSPIFNYPYDRTREALEQLRRREAWDPCHGLKMRYTNPVTGDHAMPTMGTFIQLLPKGFDGRRYRSTDATVFVAIEGRGRTRHRR